MASEAVWGTARNATSATSAMRSGSGSESSMSLTPAKLGYTAASLVPASLRSVAMTSSMFGWLSTSLQTSTPAYPVAPTTQAFMHSMRCFFLKSCIFNAIYAQILNFNAVKIHSLAQYVNRRRNLATRWTHSRAALAGSSGTRLVHEDDSA